LSPSDFHFCGKIQVPESSQLFIGVHNETPSVIAMSVSNEDYSPVAIHSGDAPPTPTGFAKIVL
jgi:hypothetical protein